MFWIHLVSNNLDLLQYTSHVRFARMQYLYATTMIEAKDAKEGKRHNEILCHMTTKKGTGLNMKVAWVHVVSLVIFSAETKAPTKQEDRTCVLASAHKPRNKGRLHNSSSLAI